MYIQIKNNPKAPVLISRKLFKRMGFTGRAPWFLQLSLIRGTDTFVIVKRTSEDTFRTQCSMLVPTGNRRTPAMFHWTIPSLDYFLAVTGIRMVTGKILKVTEIQINQTTYYKICNS